MASQAEVSKVKQELKQTENLVHDLEDELEMKDSLIVKELDIEKAAENSESISNIEAELEAELERLEINMNSSNIEIRLSDMIEVRVYTFKYALFFALPELPKLVKDVQSSTLIFFCRWSRISR